MFSPPTLKMPLLPGPHNQQDEWSVQLSVDFDNAIAKSRRNRLWDTLRFGPNILLSFAAAVDGRATTAQVDRGLCTVAIDAIVGSLGRSSDFDRSFMPRHAHLRSRWLALNQAYYVGKPLPPVDLLRVEEHYFVVDGHHRISVAKFHGQRYVEAHVIEVLTQARSHHTDRRTEETYAVYPSPA